VVASRVSLDTAFEAFCVIKFRQPPHPVVLVSIRALLIAVLLGSFMTCMCYQHVLDPCAKPAAAAAAAGDGTVVFARCLDCRLRLGPGYLTCTAVGDQLAYHDSSVLRQCTAR